MLTLPPRLRVAVALGLSAATRPDLLCELAAVALDAGLDTGADDLDGPLNAAIDRRDFGPLAATLSRIFGPLDG